MKLLLLKTASATDTAALQLRDNYIAALFRMLCASQVGSTDN